MIRLHSSWRGLSLRLALGVFCGLTAACRAAAADCASAPSGLVSWWPGDGNANDVVGANHGTLQGGATASAAGLVGSAFSFDGTNSYVAIADAPALKPTNLTVEAWVNFSGLDSSTSGTPPSVPPTGSQYIVFKQNSRQHYFEGYVLEKHRTGNGDVFMFTVGSAAGQEVILLGSTLISTSVWYHVAAVRGSNYLQLYVNGQLEGQTNVSFPQDYGTQPLYFGTSQQTYWDAKLKGRLDEVSLYNRALSGAEIAAVYAAGAAGKCKEASIVVQPESREVVEGGSVQFTVAAKGYGALSYQWRYNGASIAGATGTSLGLSNVQGSQAGSYSVVVTNSLGSATSAVAVLTVWEPPVITVPPGSFSVTVGEDANFSVTATGTAPLSYQWRFNGEALAGATGTSLSVSNVQLTDAGSYTVVASNIAGAATSALAILTVGWPAGCVVPPGGVVGWWPGEGNANDISGTNNGILLAGATAEAAGIVGAALSFDGTNGYISIPDSPALRPANLTIEGWVRFDSLDSPASGNSPAGQQYLVFKEGTHSYYFAGFALTKTRVADRDLFDFKVESAAGQSVEVVSQTAVMTGAWYHVAGVRGSNYLELYVNGQLESQTNVGFPQSYGDYPLLFGTTAQPTWDHKLAGALDEVSLFNRALSSGEISAIYAAGADGKCRAPTIVTQPESRLAAIGSNVTIAVMATGSLPLSYRWQRDGVNLTDGGNVWGAASPVLSMTNVALDDSANYRVVITNVVNAATSAVAVVAVVPELNPPNIGAQPVSQTAPGGANVEFTVGASGTAPLSYQWRLNGTNLSDDAYFSGATSSRLALKYLLWAPCQAGIPQDYTVMVTNLAGSVTSETATLNIALPPTVSFPDANLEEAVRSALSVPAGLLTPSGLLLLTNLHASGCQITNLWGLEYAGNLRSLSLPHNGIQDLASLRCLRGLAQVNLYHNRVSDLSPLGTLGNLTNLNVGDNLIADASGIADLAGLTSLWLEGNAIGDLTFLRNLTRLDSLTADRNNATSISVITNLTGLKSLALGGNPALTNYAALSKLTNLVSLSLRKSLIGDLSVLQGLTVLTSLDLYEAGLVKNVSPLTALTNLARLDISWDSSITNCAVLAGSTSLSNLYLRGVPIKKPAFLTNLYRLTLLNLDSTEISDASPVGALTNLNYLGMTANPRITNFSALSNLTRLINLELRANSISNLAFMSGLTQLGYADLAYNHISDVSPLASLTNLHSLVLAGNPTNNHGALSASSSLTNLWLFDNGISDVSFLSSMTRLTHLNLEGNDITGVTALAGLTNLTGLGLSGNSIGDYSGLGAVTNLTGLRLERSALSATNLGFLTNLTKLSFLSLEHNQIGDLGPLAGLPKLRDLYLRRNRISDISLLETLPRLLNVGVGLNRLDLGSNSAAWQVIQHVERKGVQGEYEPQNQAPRFTSLMLNRWPLLYSPMPRGFITANTTSVLTAEVWEAPLPEDGELFVRALSSIPDQAAVQAGPLPGTNYSRALSIAAGTETNQAVTITLTVTDDVLMSGTTNIELTLLPNTNVWDVCADGDPNLAVAVSWWLGKPEEEVTPADLLMLDSLLIQDASVSDPCVWQWLTNLTTLVLEGSPVSNLNGLADLTHLHSLILEDVSATDFSPLAGLAGLTNLSLNGASISNLSTLTNLTQVTSLVLHDIGVTDLAPLQGMTNLVSLSLFGPFVSDLEPLANLTRLRSLTLFKTQVTNLGPLASLTNLQYLHAQHNRLTQVSSLRDLPLLSYANLSLNLLDLSENSSAMKTIEKLIDRAVAVDYLPQRQAPALTMNTNWVVAAGAPTWLYLRVIDDVPGSDLSVTVSASNTNLMPSADLLVSQDVNGYALDWFVKLTSATSHTNTITVTAVDDVGLSTSVSSVVMVVPPLALPGSVFPEANLTSWVADTNGPWFGQTVVSHGGAPAAQSGSTTNSGRSRLEAVAVGPGILSFWWKVSCEPQYQLNGEMYYSDFLSFSVNTNEQARISGEVDWQQQVYKLPPGQHRLWWDYAKDPDTSRGMDAGWVAEVSFVPASWLQVTGAQTNGQYHLRLYGIPGQEYVIEASTNLVNWVAVQTNLVSSEGFFVFLDGDTYNFAHRFYRARLHTGAWSAPAIELGSGPSVGPTNQFSFGVLGASGQRVVIEASTNLANWIPQATNLLGTNTFYFSDPAGTNFPQRFYRAVLAP